MFKETISKEEIAELPQQSFSGNIYVIESKEDFDKVHDKLLKHPVLGFDTETKPSFRKGKKNKLALIQLSNKTEAFIFRLNKFTIPDNLIQIFENPDIIKVGVAIHDDIKAICKLKPFKSNSFVELQQYVKEFNIQDNGLRKLVANILNFRISKQQQLSNWESPELTEAQLNYAATDAWACYEIYEKLNQSKDL